MGLNYPLSDPRRMLPEVAEYYARQGINFLTMVQRNGSELRKLPGVKGEALKHALPMCELIAGALDVAFSEQGADADLSPVN